MNLCLDSGIALKWVLQEADSPKALALRGQIQARIHDIIAPDIYGLEVANGLSAVPV